MNTVYVALANFGVYIQTDLLVSQVDSQVA